MCVPAFCVYVCVTPYALQIQECVCESDVYFLLSTVTTSATNCNTHHVFLVSLVLPAFFPPSLPLPPQTRAA